MDNKLRIAFFGEDSFSTVILNSLIKAGHEICLVVTPYYDNVVYKRLELIGTVYGFIVLKKLTLIKQPLF